MDILSPALSLEETYYTEGHSLGLADGHAAGRAEGRRFGLETGFDKFAAMGALHGRALIWQQRIPRAGDGPYSTSGKDAVNGGLGEGEKNGDGACSGSRPVTGTSTGTGHDQETKPHSEQIFLSSLWQRNASSPVATEGTEEKLLPSSTHKLQLPIFRSPSTSTSASTIPTSRLAKHIITLSALSEPESLSRENDETAVSEFDDRYRRAVAKASIVGRIVGEDVAVLGASGLKGVANGSGEVKGNGNDTGEGELEDIAWRGPPGRTKQGKQMIAENSGELEIEIR